MNVYILTFCPTSLVEIIFWGQGNNWFQKKLVGQSTIIWTFSPPPPVSAQVTTPVTAPIFGLNYTAKNAIDLINASLLSPSMRCERILISGQMTARQQACSKVPPICAFLASQFPYVATDGHCPLPVNKTLQIICELDFNCRLKRSSHFFAIRQRPFVRNYRDSIVLLRSYSSFEWFATTQPKMPDDNNCFWHISAVVNFTTRHGFCSILGKNTTFCVCSVYLKYWCAANSNLAWYFYLWCYWIGDRTWMSETIVDVKHFEFGWSRITRNCCIKACIKACHQSQGMRTWWKCQCLCL